MRQEFRLMDKKSTGSVQPDDFRQVLRNYSVNLTEEEFFDLIVYNEKDSGGSVNYNKFIRSCLKEA